MWRREGGRICHASRVTTPTSTCGLRLPPCSLTMDTTPTALFDSYELDFKHIIRSISDKLEGNGKNQLGGVCAVTYYLQVSQPYTCVLRTTQSRSTQSRARAWWSRWYRTYSSILSMRHEILLFLSFFLRYLNWKLRSRSFRSRLNLLTRLV